MRSCFPVNGHRIEPAPTPGPTPQPVDLAGWTVANKVKQKHPLSGILPPGEVLVVALPQTVQLGNQGGIITLLNREDLKVDGVAYTKEQAQRESWTIVF